MRDTLEILRSGGLVEALEVNDGTSYMQKVVDGACMELRIDLNPKLRAWLARTLTEAVRGDEKGLSVISRTDSIRDMVRRALSQGDILGLVDTGKKCLLAAGGFAESKRFMRPADYLRTSEATLRRAGQLAPFLDELEGVEETTPPQGLIVPSDQLVFKKELLQLTHTAPMRQPILEEAAAHVTLMAEVVKFIHSLCIQGNLIAAIEMTPNRVLQGNGGLIY